jgi:hypothetical protein
MLRCGLPDKFTDAIVGHVGKLGAKTHYLDDDETTDAWYETCADKMTWSADVIRIVEMPKDVKDKMEQLTRENKEIKAGLTELISAIVKVSPPTVSIKARVAELIELMEKWSPGTLLGELADRNGQALLEQRSGATDDDKKAIDKLNEYMSKRKRLQISASEAAEMKK